MRKIIIDCDPGHDDAMAILLAAAHATQLEILGITTIGGNQTVEKVTQNALKVLTILKQDIPIVKGCAEPLIKKLQTAPDAHGDSGMDGPVVENIPYKPLEINVIDFLKNTITKEDKVTIIALGPLTNIALLIKSYPEIKEKIECVALMGGSTYSGNAASKAEFNFFVDPHAAKIVFNSGLKIIQAGLEISEAAAILHSEIESFHNGGRVSEFVYELFEFYTLLSKKLKKDRCAVFDACPVMYLIHPEIFETTDYHVDIEVNGDLTCGMSVVDTREWFNMPKPNTKVLTDVDRSAFVQYFIQAIGRLD